MRSLMLAFMALVSVTVQAQEAIVLVPLDGASEAIVVEQPSLTTQTTPVADAEILENEFDLEESAPITLNLEGRVSVFPMVLTASGAAGLGFFNNRVEVGVDTTLGFVAAGTSGDTYAQVGVYAKLRLIKGERSTYYIRGRAFKAFSIGDQNADGLEFGVGREFTSGGSTQGFVELSFQQFTKDDGSTHVIPFLSFGTRFGKPLRLNGDEDYLD